MRLEAAAAMDETSPPVDRPYQLVITTAADPNPDLAALHAHWPDAGGFIVLPDNRRAYPGSAAAAVWAEVMWPPGTPPGQRLDDC